MSVEVALPFSFEPGHASSSSGASSATKILDGYVLSREELIKDPQIAEEVKFAGKGKGKAKLVEDKQIAPCSSSNCNGESDDLWDALVAELLQAQECLQGADLEFVQDMLFADMLHAQESRQLETDRKLALQLTELNTRGASDAEFDKVAIPFEAHDPLTFPVIKVRGECAICYDEVSFVFEPRGACHNVDSDPEYDDQYRESDRAGSSKCNQIIAEKKGVMFPKCEHDYCADCLVQWVAQTAKDRTLPFPIQCGHANCQAVLVPGPFLEELVPAELLAKYVARHLEATGRAIYCPSQDCDSMIVLDAPLSDGEDPRILCPKCNHAACFSCRVPTHHPYTCAQYQALPEAERNPDDLKVYHMADSSQWKRCPKCHSIVDRVEGCNFIKCLCGCGFCYRCGVEYVHLIQGKGRNNHGEPGCNCGLFEVPPEPALPAVDAAVPEVLRVGGRVEDVVDDYGGMAHNYLRVQIDGTIDMTRGRDGRRQPAYGYDRLLDESNEDTPKWLKQSLSHNQCYYCRAYFRSLAQLNHHLLTTRSHPVYICCRRIFQKALSLQQHACAVHRHEEQNGW